MATYSNSRIQLRIDTEANWQSNHPTIEAGEICLSSDKKDFKVGGGGDWRDAAYWIAQNPTVIAINTTANNAANTASQAMSKANQALSTAQAAAQSAGRVTNYEFIHEKVEASEAILVDDEFLKNFQNNDIIGLGYPVGDSNKMSITIESPTAEGNEIRFYLQTSAEAEDLFIIECDQIGSTIMLIGDTTIYADSAVTFPPNAYVEICIIDGCVLKYTYTAM